MFAGKREQVEALYRSFPYWADPDHGERSLEFYEDFWRVLESQGRFEDQILEHCTPMPR
jgi:hypothetical protein